eukprot:scaffold173_cov221-Pinguiococcus_pyrenoidosus.AAC.6
MAGNAAPEAVLLLSTQDVAMELAALREVVLVAAGPEKLWGKKVDAPPWFVSPVMGTSRWLLATLQANGRVTRIAC